MGLNYQKSVQDSSREPSGSYNISMHTDTVSGRINHTIDKLNLGFQTSYSMMNDKTSSNNDTTTVTCSFTPSYTLQDISLSSGFSFNQSQYHRTDLMTDTYTINLDVRTKFLKKEVPLISVVPITLSKLMMVQWITETSILISGLHITLRDC